jgi:hypothetical protein
MKLGNVHVGSGSGLNVIAGQSSKNKANRYFIIFILNMR